MMQERRRHAVSSCTYPLAAYVRQQEWLYDRIVRELAQARARTEEDGQTLLRLRTNLTAQTQHLAQARAHGINPWGDAAALAFLAQLHQSIQVQQQRLEQSRQLQHEVQSRCTLQQRKLEGLAEHEDQFRQEHHRETERAAAAELDREWLTHLDRRGASVSSSSEEHLGF